MKRSENAFTMIEVLAVIFVIAVLAAILVPTTSKALLWAGSIKSASNLRQIGATAFQYAADHENKIPVAASNNPYFWLDCLYPLASGGKPFPGFDAAGNSLKGTIFHSPNMKATEAEPRRSYGWNGNLNSGDLSDLRITLNRVARPGQAAVCSDSIGSSAMGTVAPPVIKITVNYRNAGRANILFVDGHVESRLPDQVPSKITDSDFKTFWFLK